MKAIYVTVFLSLMLFDAHGNNVQISNVTYNSGSSQLSFDISWENSWTSGGGTGLRDAVWVFIKQAPMSGAQWVHADVASATPPGNLFAFVPSDNKGIMVRRSTIGVGTIPPSTIIATLTGLVGAYQDFKVFAIEMVNIPAGPYYLGDTQSSNTFHDGSGINQPYLVNSNGAIITGTSSGQLDGGGQAGGTDFNSNYPNGHDGFHCMKYEISQQQYVDFLNCLTRDQQDTRTATDLSVQPIVNNYVMSNSAAPIARNGISCAATTHGAGPIAFFCDLNPGNAPESNDDGQNLSGNYLTRNDVNAYLDWAALRPMSILEYEKICRGPMPSVAQELAWGTTEFTLPSSITNSGQPDETFDNVGMNGLVGSPGGKLARNGFAATTTSDRITSGAGFYGNMELTGNVGELVIVDPSYNKNSLGDGALAINGDCNIFSLNSGYTRKGLISGGTPQSVSEISTVFLNNVAGDSRWSYSGGRGVR